MKTKKLEGIADEIMTFLNPLFYVFVFSFLVGAVIRDICSAFYKFKKYHRGSLE